EQVAKSSGKTCCAQLGIASLRARIDVGDQENLKLRVRKNDGSHIPAVADQAGSLPKRSLALQQSVAQWLQRCDPRGHVTDMLLAQLLCDVVVVKQHFVAVKSDIQLSCNVGQHLLVGVGHTAPERCERAQPV